MLLEYAARVGGGVGAQIVAAIDDAKMVQKLLCNLLLENCGRNG